MSYAFEIVRFENINQFYCTVAILSLKFPAFDPYDIPFLFIAIEKRIHIELKIILIIRKNTHIRNKSKGSAYSISLIAQNYWPVNEKNETRMFFLQDLFEW